MTADAALKTLGEIYVAFGFPDVTPAEDSELFPLLVADRLAFDAASDVVTYSLAAPLELKNGEKLAAVTFREPAASELEYIRKGVMVGDSSHVFSVGDLVTMTLRTLIKTGNLSTNIADRIKSRDVDALAKVLAELGFFFR